MAEKGPKEKLYEKVEEAEEIIEQLTEKYPDELWAVKPNIITVLGVTNKDRPKSSRRLAQISSLRGATKSLMQINSIGTRYIIELYWSDWHLWTKAQKVAVIFHELLHQDCEIGKIVKHDVEDFRMMVSKLGVDWFNKSDLPDLLETKVKFDLSLRPNIPEDGNFEVDTGDEIVEEEVQEEVEAKSQVVEAKSQEDNELFDE